MTVALIPMGLTSANVVLDGVTVGAVERVRATKPYVDLDGVTRAPGFRWLPAGERLPANLTPGPQTKGHAALLLLALHGHDVEAAAPNLLGLTRKAS